MALLLVAYLVNGFKQRGAGLHPEREGVERSLGTRITDGVSDCREGFKDWLEQLLGYSERPLLPPPQLDQFNRKPRTLVLGLEDVLIHLDWDRYTSHVVKERPELKEFLQSALRQGWELVLFSSKPQFEVEAAIAQFDKEGALRHRLYYEQTNMRHFHLVKDASRLGRERKRVLVVDWNAAMWQGSEDNLYRIDKWEAGEQGIEDRELRKLAAVLDRIVRYNVQDVREVVRRREQGRDASQLFAEEEEIIRKASQALQQRQTQGKRGKQRAAVVDAEKEAPATVPSPAQSWLGSIGAWLQRSTRKQAQVPATQQD